MPKVSTNISLDAELKKSAQELFADFGIDITTAITLFLRQSVREQRIPFEIKRVPEAVQSLPDSDVMAVSKQLIESNRDAYEELAK